MGSIDSIPKFLRDQIRADKQKEDTIPPFLKKKESGSSASGSASLGGTIETSPSPSPIPSNGVIEGDTFDTLTNLERMRQPQKTEEDPLIPIIEAATRQQEYISFNPDTKEPEKGILTDLMKQENVRRIKQKDPEMIKQVVLAEKQRIKNQREAALKEVAGQQHVAGSASMVIAANNINKRLEQFDEEEKKLLHNAADIITAKHRDDFQNGTDHSQEAQIAFGEKQRKDLHEIGYDKSSYDRQKAEMEASQKYDWVSGRWLGLIKEKHRTDPEKTNEIFRYTNQRTLLESIKEKQETNLEKLVQTPEVTEYLQLGAVLEQQQKAGNTAAAMQTALRMQSLVNEPNVVSVLKNKNDLGVTYEHLKSLPDRYPQVKIDQERDKFIKFVAKRYGEAGHKMPSATQFGKVYDVLSDFFAGHSASEKDIQDFAKQEGINESIVREYAKDAHIPSGIRTIGEAGAGVFASLDQYTNRLKTQLGTQELGVTEILNREIEGTTWKLPDPLTVKGLNSLTTRNVVYTVSQGLGEMAVYAGLAEVGGSFLGALGKGAIAMSGGLPEIASVEKILQKANQLGSLYGVGYAQSYESAYITARQYTSDESLAKQYANGDAFWNGISELILPDISVVKRALLKKNLQNIFLKAIQGKAPMSPGQLFRLGGLEVAKIMALEDAEEIFPLAYETLAKNRLFDQNIGMPEFLRQAYETVVQTSISTLPLGIAGARGVPSSHLTKASLFEAGTTPDIFKELNQAAFNSGKITEEQLNKGNKIIATMADIVPQIGKDNLGNDLSQEQKVELASRMFQQRVLKEQEKVADESLQGGIKEDISNNKKAIDDVLNGEPGEYARQTATPKTAIDILEKNKSSLPPMYQAHMLERPEELLSQIADHALNKISPELYSADQAMQAANRVFGEQLVKEAIAFTNIKSNQNEKASSTVEPAQQEQGNVQAEGSEQQNIGEQVDIPEKPISDQIGKGGQIDQTNVGATEGKVAPTIEEQKADLTKKVISHKLSPDLQGKEVNVKRSQKNGSTKTISVPAMGEVRTLQTRHNTLEQLINCIGKG